MSDIKSFVAKTSRANEFYPVQCTQEVLDGLTPAEGYLYFTTDTKKIYLGKSNGMLPMCASSGIFYGTKQIDYDDSGSAPDPNVLFTIDEIEGDDNPEVDDLILNVDGCFYRVQTADSELGEFATTRLTLQGTGIGGGSSSGGSSVGSANLRINHYDGQNRYFAKESTEAELGVIAYSDDTANYISKIELSWDKDFIDIFKTVDNLSVRLEKPYYVDISKFLSNISTKGTRIYLRVTDKYGSSRFIFYNVTIASLQLAELENALLAVTESSIDYKCRVGGSLELDSRIIKYELYASLDADPVYETELELTATQSGQTTKTIDLSSVGHGDYTLKVQMIGTIGIATISSNILTHKILRYDENVGLPVFSILVPDVIEQYTPFTISYMMAYGNTSKTYPVQILIDDVEVTTEEIYANEINTYTMTFETKGNRYLRMVIDELGIDQPVALNVIDYTGELPVINVDRDDLKIYLTAKGRTNNALDKEYWPDAKNAAIRANLNNFYYRSVNGWVTDNDGIECLKVSQGATVELDSYSPFAIDPQTNGLTVELDFMIDGILDYSANLIECVSRLSDNSIKTGFVVQGDTFKYYVTGKEEPLVTLNLVQGKRIKLSFILEASNSQKYPMCYTFLNGIISNAVNYDKSWDFNNGYKPGYLKIDSTGGQINVYNIRFYSIGLDEQTVLNNYQATIGSLEERQKNYYENSIRNLEGNIDLEAVESQNYNLQIPYVKIYGGYQANKDFSMTAAAPNNIPALPTGKKTFKAIDIEIIYPKEHQNSYFKNYKDFNVTTTFEDSTLNVINGFGNMPIEGAIMYAQGTSSMEYPVKNLRVKLKGKKFTVRQDIAPVELVTFKADFMESAGAHNTGAANFVDDAYSSIEISTPGQTHYESDPDAGKIVTCIKGHPCIIFWNPGVDADGNILDKDDPANYTFIGKYNFNLDKATPEPFGFMNDENDETFGYEVDENGELVLDEEGNKQNSIYCFEFLDNGVAVCNFKSDSISRGGTDDIEGPPSASSEEEKEHFRDTWYSNRVSGKDIIPGWARGFESRYPEDKLGVDDADALWPLASWLNELYAIRYIDGNDTLAIQRFKDEYQQYLDTDFLIAYYIITEALLMADSRVKNMMIATWGKEHRTWTTDAGEERSTFDYVWYPIFYDMDTMLGLDNTGRPNKNYYDEDTQEDVFNGDEYLWKFVRDALPFEIAAFYDRLESAGNKILTESAVIPYFNDNQATLANETFYNEDAFYKYIDTFRNGYTDDSTGKYIEPGTGSRLYAAQGDRAMMREWFIENRLRYLRGKYSSTNYQNGDRIEFRLTYPKKVENPTTEKDIRTNASIAAIAPSGAFNYVSAKTGYSGVKLGANGTPVNKRFVNEQAQSIVIDTSSASGTEIYLLGLSNLSDVGDLSDKYLYNLIIGAAQNNLTRLILGNHHKDYYNPYWSNVTEPMSLNGFRFLRVFNLENCDTFTNTIDFTESPQIEEIYLTGSRTSALTLPVGGVLKELRIPTTITDLIIDAHPTLYDDCFTLGHFDYDENDTTGLLGHYVNDFSKLIKLYINNTNINTYNIVRSLALANNLDFTNYGLLGINWEVTDSNDCVYTNGVITGIKVLDYLLTKTPHRNVKTQNPADALIGTITINVPGATINEYNIYQKYHNSYPNLSIAYGDDIIVERAKTIEFFNREIIDDNDEPYYTVLSNGSQSLAVLTSKDGPAGAALTDPVKMSSTTKDYTFDNKWRIWEDGKELEAMSVIEVSQFDTYVPAGNMKLVPVFTESTRYYSVVLYDHNRVELVNKQLTYQTTIYDGLVAAGVDPALLGYVYRDDSDIADKTNYKWSFQGWISARDFSNEAPNPSYFDLKTHKISANFVAYAHYEEENFHNVATKEEYFDFEETTISDTLLGTETIFGYRIHVKEMYRNALAGKITLPQKYNNINIVEIGDFAYMPKITHVYFQNKEQCNYIQTMAKTPKGRKGCGFSYEELPILSQLQVVDLPPSIKIINDKAFCNCCNLIILPLNDNILRIGDTAIGVTSTAYSSSNARMQTQINELPLNLVELRSSAFYGNLGVTFTKIPDGVVDLSAFAFVFCSGVNISKLGNENGGKLQAVGQYALHDTGYNVTDLYVYSSVNVIGPDQFEGGWSNLKNVYFARSNYADSSGNTYSILDGTAQSHWGLKPHVATHVLA